MSAKIQSLRKKFYKLSKSEILIIKQSSKKILNKLGMELNHKWWKECRSFTTNNKTDSITTYILYHVPSGNIYSTVSIVHEMDKDKQSEFLAKRIATSKMGGNIAFITDISKLKKPKVYSNGGPNTITIPRTVNSLFIDNISN